MSGELSDSARAQAIQQYIDCLKFCKTRLTPPVENGEEFQVAFKPILDLAATALTPYRTVEIFYQAMHRIASLDETVNRSGMLAILRLDVKIAMLDDLPAALPHGKDSPMDGNEYDNETGQQQQQGILDTRLTEPAVSDDAEDALAAAKAFDDTVVKSIKAAEPGYKLDVVFGVKPGDEAFTPNPNGSCIPLASLMEQRDIWARRKPTGQAAAAAAAAGGTPAAKRTKVASSTETAEAAATQTGSADTSRPQAVASIQAQVQQAKDFKAKSGGTAAAAWEKASLSTIESQFVLGPEPAGAAYPACHKGIVAKLRATMEKKRKGAAVTMAAETAAAEAAQVAAAAAAAAAQKAEEELLAEEQQAKDQAAAKKAKQNRRRAKKQQKRQEEQEQQERDNGEPEQHVTDEHKQCQKLQERQEQIKGQQQQKLQEQQKLEAQEQHWKLEEEQQQQQQKLTEEYEQPKLQEKKQQPEKLQGRGEQQKLLLRQPGTREQQHKQQQQQQAKDQAEAFARAASKAAVPAHSPTAAATAPGPTSTTKGTVAKKMVPVVYPDPLDTQKSSSRRAGREQIVSLVRGLQSGDTQSTSQQVTSDCSKTGPQADSKLGQKRFAALRHLFCCPITKEVMINPVIAADGYTYEKDAVEPLLLLSDISPVTGLTLQHTKLTPNLAISCANHELL